jgi:hypothetical protein
VTAFSKLLSAIYGQPYCLSSCEELIAITSLARFYLVLSTVSRSLYGAIFHKESWEFRLGMPKYVCQILAAAAELRHSDLFRDTIIFSLGPWESPVYQNLGYRKLYKICQNAYNALCAKIVKTHSGILDAGAQFEEDRSLREFVNNTAMIADECGNDIGYVPLPLYYRKLYDREITLYEVAEAFKEQIGPLVENNLALYRVGEVPLGDMRDDLKGNYFLCVTVDDEDLQWDTTQIEW